MEKVIKYLSEVLGIEVNSEPPAPEIGAGLPLYLKMRKMAVISFERQKAILVEINSLQEITPLQLEKQKQIYEHVYSAPVVFCFKQLESFERKRLIERRISFIVENKQIYIPSLAMNLSDYKSRSRKTVTSFSPAAQFLLLYHLQKESLNRKWFGEMSGYLEYYAPISLSRAAKELEAKGLCKLYGSKEKQLAFDLSPKELWKTAILFLQSPVKKKLYVNQRPESEKVIRSGDEALAHYTSLNETGRIQFAVGEKAWKKLSTDTKSYPSEFGGSICIEIWKYPPAALGNNKNFADPLSLYLCYEDDEDERVQIALKELLEKVQW